MKFETKTIKVESIYVSAYTDRYRRLGYEVCDAVQSEEDGKKFTSITIRRDVDSPAYPSLSRLEQEVEELCRMAKEHAGEPDNKIKKHRMTVWILFGAGCLLMAVGVALLVAGLILNEIVLALCGWGCAIAGAALVIAWSCLREKWRLRKVDVRDDAENPGFGIDEYSKKVEECLKQAEEALEAVL